MTAAAARGTVPDRRRGMAGLLVLAVGGLVGLVPGCQRDPFGLGQTVPVVGRVFVNGQPLHLGERAFGRVWFYPDPTKGNACTQVAVGDLDLEGHYQLFTRARAGAPPGWYRVMVIATEQIDANRPSRRRLSFVNRRYAAIETSGLRVQVVAEPAAGAYDLKLQR